MFKNINIKEDDILFSGEGVYKSEDNGSIFIENQSDTHKYATIGWGNCDLANGPKGNIDAIFLNSGINIIRINGVIDKKGKDYTKGCLILWKNDGSRKLFYFSINETICFFLEEADRCGICIRMGGGSKIKLECISIIDENIITEIILKNKEKHIYEIVFSKNSEGILLTKDSFISEDHSDNFSALERSNPIDAERGIYALNVTPYKINGECEIEIKPRLNTEGEIVSKPGAYFIQSDKWIDYRDEAYKNISKGEESSVEIAVSGFKNIKFCVLAYEKALVADAKAIVDITFYKSDGSICYGNHGIAVNPKFGAYSYIKLGTSTSTEKTEFDLVAPPDSAILSIKAIEWKKGKGDVYVAICQPEKVSREELAKEELWSQFILGTSKIIFIVTTAPPIGHKTLSLRPNRLAIHYSSMGYKVVFVPFSSLQHNSSFPKESVMQIARNEIHIFSQFLIKHNFKESIFIISSFPDSNNLAIAHLLKKYGWKIIYEVRDDMEEFNRVGYSKWYYPMIEYHCVNLADKVISVSDTLSRKMKSVSLSKEVKFHTIPNASPDELVLLGQELRTSKAWKLRAEHKTIGYMGHMTASWFDWDLLANVGEALPDVEIELIGHGATDEIMKHMPANIRCIGPKSHEEFIELSRKWSAGLIPFTPSPLTLAVDPNKIYEYLSVGLRVLTTEMGQVRQCPSTYVYNSTDDLINIIPIIFEPMSRKELKAIESFLSKNKWSDRARQMIEVMSE